LSKIAIVTDSNSGITQKIAGEMGIYVLPMPFTIDGKEYFEDINLTQEEFYEKLKGDADIATSQPSPDSILKLWNQLLQEYDEVLHIPMSSGLSGSCQTAMALSLDYDGKVYVVNNQRISITQREAVEDAIALMKSGKSAAQIKAILEETKMESSIYITVATLKYLKKGGRITPAVAAIGTMLRLKPVLTIQGDKLDSFSKARTMSQARQTMIDAIRNDIAARFGDVDPSKVILDIAHTNNEAEALRFRDEVAAAFPEYKVNYVAPLSLSVSCHIGDGALAVAVTKILHHKA
jgi:DegV family protein with EDD domain